MKLETISQDIYQATCPTQATSKDIQQANAWQERQGLLTYGGFATDCIAEMFEQKGYQIVKDEISRETDATIELDMPNVWYLNKGTEALTIPRYYNFLQNKLKVKDESIFTDNKDIHQEFGRVAMVEVYTQNELEGFLQDRQMNYFGTPKTLTECMRVLEGWDLERVPRLKSYVDYAEFIREYFIREGSGFDESHWGLGRVPSEEIIARTGTNNVREAIKFFWKNYLMRKDPKIGDGDVEIDIISPRFARERQPQFVLLGEDFLDLDNREGSEEMSFHYFHSQARSVGLLQEPNKKNRNLAHLVKEQFPESKIILFQYYNPSMRFTMTKSDEQKHANDMDSAFLAQAMRELL